MTRFAAMSPYFDVDRIRALRTDDYMKGTRVWVWAHAYGLPLWGLSFWSPSNDPEKKRYFCLRARQRQSTASGRSMILEFYPEIVLFTGTRAWEVPELRDTTVTCMWADYLRIRRRLKKLVVPAGVEPFEAAGDLAQIFWGKSSDSITLLPCEFTSSTDSTR